MKQPVLIPPFTDSVPTPPPGCFSLYTRGNSVVAIDSNRVVTTVAFGGNSIVTDATTARTLTKADNGKLIDFTSASAVTVTVPKALPAGFNCALLQSGAGTVTVAAGAGATVNSVDAALAISGQHGSASVVRKEDGTFNLSGALA